MQHVDLPTRMQPDAQHISCGQLHHLHVSPATMLHTILLVSHASMFLTVCSSNIACYGCFCLPCLYGEVSEEDMLIAFCSA